MKVSVVVCSLNGVGKIESCLEGLKAQLYRDHEVIVVDDGSTDATESIARSFGVRVVRHQTNQGLAAARNTGIGVAQGDLVAFTDDDCVPPREWLCRLVEVFDRAEGQSALAVGGSVDPVRIDSLALRYVRAHNPLSPLELELATSSKPLYRLAVYLRQIWAPRRYTGVRTVYSLVGANMAFRRESLSEIGLFDERIRFGGEEEDVCRRLREKFGSDCLLFDPDIRLSHAYESTVRDMLRRSRAYGRGNARTYLKSASRIPPVRPFPILMLAIVLAGLRWPRILSLAVALPLVLYPNRRLESPPLGRDKLTFPFIGLFQETAALAGFLEGWIRFRKDYRGTVQVAALDKEMASNSTERWLHRDREDEL